MAARPGSPPLQASRRSRPDGQDEYRAKAETRGDRVGLSELPAGIEPYRPTASPGGWGGVEGPRGHHALAIEGWGRYARRTSVPRSRTRISTSPSVVAW